MSLFQGQSLNPPAQLASHAVEYQQNQQNAETDSVQGQEQAWHPNKLRGGSNVGDQHSNKTQYEEWRQRRSELHTKCWMKNMIPMSMFLKFFCFWKTSHAKNLQSITQQKKQTIM